jgi:putative zinc finger protein
MPDTNSPKVTRVERDLPIMFFEREPDQTLLSRKWSCPGDHTIAAYADDGLDRLTKAWIEFHLSSCQRCRTVVAHIVKVQRESDLPLPPVQVIQKAMGLAERRTAPRRWVWAPAGALAAIALLAVFAIVLRKPQQLVSVSLPAPAAPLVAKSEPTPAVRTPVPDVVRKPRTLELRPTILSPEANSVMNSDRLQFRWKPVPQSRNYEVRVVRSDGDLVWEGQTDKSALQLPSEVTVKDGSYFIWITAYLENGRIAKSVPVRFLVKR